MARERVLRGESKERCHQERKLKQWTPLLFMSKAKNRGQCLDGVALSNMVNVE